MDPIHLSGIFASERHKYADHTLGRSVDGFDTPLDKTIREH